MAHHEPPARYHTHTSKELPVIHEVEAWKIPRRRHILGGVQRRRSQHERCGRHKGDEVQITLHTPGLGRNRGIENYATRTYPGNLINILALR